MDMAHRDLDLDLALHPDRFGQNEKRLHVRVLHSPSPQECRVQRMLVVGCSHQAPPRLTSTRSHRCGATRHTRSGTMKRTGGNKLRMLVGRGALT